MELFGFSLLELAGLGGSFWGSLKFLDFILSVVPRLSKAKAAIFAGLSSATNHFFFKRAAIKSDIESTVNEVVFKLQDELPSGWIKRASVKWVRDLESRDKAPEGEIIVRVRPVQNQSLNLMFAVKTFFSNALFPDMLHVIPEIKSKACIMLLTKRALVNKSPSLTENFNKILLESEIQADVSFIRTFTSFERLDNFGFFTSALLREIASVTNGSMYNELRANLSTEIDQIVDHMKAFTNELGSGNGKVTTAKWSRVGPVNGYSFLLVAHPNISDTSVYITRTKEKIEQGVTRLYILAKEEQRQFAKQVIQAIVCSTEFEIEDTFSLHRDYRNNLGGYGAVLRLKKT